MDPLISIIMPVYNTERYLERSIASILHQTYENWELLVVDDGSTDDSFVCLKNIQRRDARIRLFHKENGGAASARNYALDRAQGTYIMFVDSDDAYEADCIETCYNALREHRADACLFNFDCIDENGNITEGGDAHPIGDEIINPDQIFLRTYQKNGYMFALPCNKLVKREAFDGLRFSDGMRMCEDEVLFPRLIERCPRIVCVSRVLYHYWIHQGSIMHDVFSLKQLDQLRAYWERIRFYRETKRVALRRKAEEEYWYNIAPKYIRYDLKLAQNKAALRSVKKQYDQVFCSLMRNPLLPAKEKIKSFLFFVSPRAYKKYILWRSKDEHQQEDN